MKRSEMIRLLDKVITSHCDYGTVFYDEDLERVLKVIKEAGMLPPPTMTTTLGQWEEE